MAISKEKKKETLVKLKGIAASKSLAFVNFHGLTVENANELRRKLKEKAVSYFVAKKTLVRKALGEAGIGGEMPELKGEVAVAYSEDLLAPARETFSFQKKFENKLSLLGGVFEGKFIGEVEVKSLAMIPSRETLYAQFVNIINSPIQQFAVVLGAIAQARGK